MRTSTLADRKKIDFCKEYNLDSNEYDLLIAIRIAQEGSNTEFFDLVTNFINQGLNIREMLISLKEKKVINKDYKVPLVEWRTDDDKADHEFDIWINNKTSEVKIYKSNNWITPSNELLNLIIDSSNELTESCRVFINPISTPYNIGDFIINDNLILKASSSRKSGCVIRKHFEPAKSSIGKLTKQYKQEFNGLCHKQKFMIWKTSTDPSSGGSLEMKAIPINKNVISKHLKASLDMFREIYELYPKFLNCQGKMVPAKNVTRYYNDEDCLGVAYGRKIRNNLGVHEEIMRLYRWGLDNKLIKWTIIEFVGSSKWEELKYIKEHPELLSQFVSVDIMNDLN